MPYFFAIPLDNRHVLIDAHPTIESDNYVIVPLGPNRDFDASRLPKSMTVDYPDKSIPGLFSIRYGYAVHEQLKDKIEELEPGVHQFIEFELVTRGGVVSKNRYFFLNIRNVVSALDEDHSKLPENVDFKNRYIISNSIHSPIEARIVFKKNIVKEKCLWIEEKMGFNNNEFISDELYNFIVENKLAKMDGKEVFVV